MFRLPLLYLIARFWMRLQGKHSVYQPIGHKMLRKHNIGFNSVPRYVRGIAVSSYVMPRRGAVPESIVDVEELCVPTLEMASNPSVRYNEYNVKTLYKTMFRAEDALIRLQDLEVFKVINAAVPSDHIVSTNELSPESLNRAITRIREHELPVGLIVINPTILATLKNWSQYEVPLLKWNNKLKQQLTGSIATYDSIPIYITSVCPRNTIFVMAPKKHVGVLPVRRKITALRADEPKRLRRSWVMFTDVGFGVINDYSIAKIITTNELPPTEVLDKTL